MIKGEALCATVIVFERGIGDQVHILVEAFT